MLTQPTKTIKISQLKLSDLTNISLVNFDTFLTDRGSAEPQNIVEFNKSRGKSRGLSADYLSKQN